MKYVGIVAFAILAFANNAQAAQICKTKVDVLFVVEDTAALNSTTSFKIDAATNMLAVTSADTYVRDFLATIENYFTLSNDTDRVGFQLYDDANSRLGFNLNKFTETTDARAAILTTQFQKKDVPFASIQKALDFTQSTMLTVDNGERSCWPTTIILLSYSSRTDPNSNSIKPIDYPDVASARILQNYGAQIIVVGVGPKRDAGLLLEIASDGKYIDLNTFSDLTDDVAIKIAEMACNYVPDGSYYPSPMDEMIADIVFVVDVSQAFSLTTLQPAVTSFITTFLKPYDFTPERVRASLVTYDKVADVAIPLSGSTSATSYNDFIKKVDATFAAPSVRQNPERYIFNALDTVRYHVLQGSHAARPNVERVVYVFAAGCFTGPDPVSTAEAIRNDENATLYLVSIAPKATPLPPFLRSDGANVAIVPNAFGFWKEALDITGDPQKFFDVTEHAEIVLPSFFTKLAWRQLAKNYVPPPPPTTVSPVTGSTTSPGSVTTTTAATTTETTTTAATTTTTVKPPE